MYFHLLVHIPLEELHITPLWHSSKLRRRYIFALVDIDQALEEVSKLK